MAAGRLREAFRAWRPWYLSAAVIERRVARVDKLVRGTGKRVEQGLALAHETLVHAPYHPGLHRSLARVAAARGDRDAYVAAVCACFQLHDLDAASLRAATDLHGAFGKQALAQLIKDATAGVGGDRTRDFCFDEVAPRTGRFTTTLTWPRRHQDAVRAAHARFAYRSALTEQYVFPNQARPSPASAAETYAHHVGDGTMALESETMPGAFCHLGSVVQFVQEVAPYVDDLRCFFYDQVSPLDELWVVDHAFYMRRHPVADGRSLEAARYLDDLLRREQIADPALAGYLGEQLTELADDCATHIGSAYLDADELRRDAEELMGRAAHYLGAPPAAVRAKLHLRDGDTSEAIAALEETIAGAPTDSASMLRLAQLYVDRGDLETALAVTEQILALPGRAPDRLHWLRGELLTKLRRPDDALAAYEHHGRATSGFSGVVLSDARHLLAAANPAAARLLFHAIRRAGLGTGIAAELGLAQCAAALGDDDLARTHYQRVVERARQTPHADAPSIHDAISACEQAALAALAAARR